MTAHRVIPDTEIDQDSPLITQTLVALRDNLQAAFEGNAPFTLDTAGITALAVTTAKVAANAITQAKIVAATPGVYIEFTGPETTAAVASYTKCYEIKLPRGGEYRIRIGCKVSAGTGYWKVYQNGGAVGTEESTTSTSFVWSPTSGGSEDIAGWSAGDLLQIYTYNSSALNTNTTKVQLLVDDPMQYGLHKDYEA